MGVLFEAADDVAELLVPFLRSEGSTSPAQTVQDAYLRASLGEISAAQLWQLLLPSADRADDVNTRYLRGHRTRPDALELVAAANRLAVPIACVSNDVSEWSRSLRVGLELDRSIPHWIVSGDVGVRKPDHAIFRIALATIGASPEECVFIDDRAANVAAAAALGITALQFVPHMSPSDISETQIADLTEATRWLAAK
jgi:FMN phosphatase YigB (HAD superfamily)